MAANWKMYKTQDEARNTVRELIKILGKNLDVDREVLICPPFTSLSVVAHEIKDIHYVSVGGQNFYPANEGAYTGEISLRCYWMRDVHMPWLDILKEDISF